MFKPTKFSDRETGYYWVRVKRTQNWIIALWSKTYQAWSTFELYEHDTRGGFDMIEPTPIERKRVRTDHIKRIRMNVEITRTATAKDTEPVQQRIHRRRKK